MQHANTGKDPQFIKNLFGSIAGTYDRANDAITFGMAHLWRSDLVRWSGVRAGGAVLDCATGTGDLAFAFLKRVGGAGGTVCGIDFCPEMIELAEKKNRARDDRVRFSVADAMALPFGDDAFDVTSIAYGIRNVADISRAVREMARVTRPGGSVMILETGEIENPVVRAGVGFYFKSVVPTIGGWVSGRRHAYQYLADSSDAFPSGETFCSLLRSTGAFSSVECRALMGGASFIYRAVVG